ncbi:MAG: MGMT family protein [Candidatus Diapherotrites archaeon]
MKDFREKVFQIIIKIPKGKITTYQEIAKALGNKNLARAVGKVCGSNGKLIEIPCHRVIRSNGLLGGYKLGTNKKAELLRKEGFLVKQNKVLNYENNLVRF